MLIIDYLCIHLCVPLLFKAMKTDKTATTGIILEKRKSNIDKLHPVKLRVTFHRERKYYTMKGLDKKSLYMAEADFNTYLTAVKFKPLKTHLGQIEDRAMEVIKGLTMFSFEAFEAEYFSKVKDKYDLFSIMASTGKELRNAGRISTAVTFECGLNSLKEFTGKEKFPFGRVTVKFLKDYEKWMLTPRIIKGRKKAKVNSRTTVGIYLRNVRTVFNQIKPVGVPYPFGKSKYGLYSIPKGKNTKKALTLVDIAQIAAHHSHSGSVEERSRDFWLFSYLCNGINIKDMARLRYSNIKGEKIVLIRAKTAESVEEETTIEIMITKPIGRIIDRWGNKPADRDEYILPILRNGMTPEDEYRAIQQAVQTINKKMENICEDLEIERVTTYYARHSFATVLKRSGASIEFIGESLGHRNTQTTQNYLANFEDEEKRKWANTLLPESD